MMFTPINQLAGMISSHAAQAQCDRADSSYHLQQMIALQGQAYAQNINSSHCYGEALLGSIWDDLDDSHEWL